MLVHDRGYIVLHGDEYFFKNFYFAKKQVKHVILKKSYQINIQIYVRKTKLYMVAISTKSSVL